MAAVYYQDFITVDFSTSDLLSDAFQITRRVPAYLQFPATWDSTAVQQNNISFQGSIDGSTFSNLYGGPNPSGGTEVTVVALQGGLTPLDPTSFYNMNFLKIRSGLSSSGVFQTAPRTVAIGLGRFLSDGKKS